MSIVNQLDIIYFDRNLTIKFFISYRIDLKHVIKSRILLTGISINEQQFARVEIVQKK